MPSFCVDSSRSVPIGRATVEALRAHGTALTHRFQRILARTGLPRLRFHDLRHTAATRMLGQGVHPKVVSERLGHSTPTLTLTVYSHVTPTMRREAAAALDALLGG